ncbi:MAG: hypothetical protein JWN38_641 [Candidatus Saccharibacteria bacterium]|nr:hypothetical protein [Candidatus Saccharibacteria bacterium]
MSASTMERLERSQQEIDAEFDRLQQETVAAEAVTLPPAPEVELVPGRGFELDGHLALHAISRALEVHRPERQGHNMARYTGRLVTFNRYLG